MTEERLNEIKNSIDFQITATKAHGYDETLINEELELYNEVVRLRKIIKEAENRLYNIEINANYTDIEKALRDTLHILKQSNLTLEQLTGVEND